MSDRTTLTLTLAPVTGHRFQPTGFPDLGAALFDRPDGRGGWVRALHVESPQSMANRLEGTTWDDAAMAQPTELDGLPYVRVVNADGEVMTSSRLEPHRLASAYIMEGAVVGTDQTGHDWFRERLGLVEQVAIDQRRVARALFEIDPVSLVHGVFFARPGWPWQPKVARSVTCFIDADDVRPAISGGVKTDSVNSKGGNADTGYGYVPHQRVEYTAQRIVAYLTIDHEQVRSYGLDDAATEVVEALIGFEIAQLFSGDGLRLRTACDLKVEDIGGGEIAAPAAALDRLQSAIHACDSLGEITDVVWTERKGKKTKGDV
jgi:CRISPR-associated protein Csb1